MNRDAETKEPRPIRDGDGKRLATFAHAIPQEAID
jgi:hypothetical protein